MDVLCLSKMKLDANILDSELLIPGYNLISRNDRTRVGGGMGCYVKYSLTTIDKIRKVSPPVELSLHGLKCAIHQPKPAMIGSLCRPLGAVKEG